MCVFVFLKSIYKIYPFKNKISVSWQAYNMFLFKGKDRSEERRVGKEC